jgi:hypothetical protein
MVPSNRRQCNTIDHRECHEGRAVTRQYAVPAMACCSILLNLRNLLSLFPGNLFSKKKDRAAFAGGPCQGGNARGKGSDSGGWGSYRVSYFENPKAPRIDEAQFSTDVSRFCVATVRIAAGHVGGTRTPCSRRNAPTTLIASATKRPRVSASASPSRAVILRSNTIDVPLATSAQVNVRARNGVTFRSPCFRPKIAQFAVVRWPASRYLNP